MYYHFCLEHTQLMTWMRFVLMLLFWWLFIHPVFIVVAGRSHTHWTSRPGWRATNRYYIFSCCHCCLIQLQLFLFKVFNEIFFFWKSSKPLTTNYSHRVNIQQTDSFRQKVQWKTENKKKSMQFTGWDITGCSAHCNCYVRVDDKT